MSRFEMLATAVWAVWALRLASLGVPSRGSLWIAAVTGSLLALTWSALLGAVILIRIRPPRSDLWALVLCPVAWLIAAGAIVWTDLDLLKKLPLINRMNWEQVIGNTAVWPVNRTPSVHDRYVQQARAADAVDILWVGDSNTNNWRTDGSDVWDREYGRLKCLNFGFGGDRTQDILWRLEHGELEGPEPRVVVLEAGANNLYHNTVEEIASAIRAIVAVIRGRLPGAKIIVIAIFPRGNHIEAPINAKIRAVNARLAVLDDGADPRLGHHRTVCRCIGRPSSHAAERRSPPFSRGVSHLGGGDAPATRGLARSDEVSRRNRSRTTRRWRTTITKPRTTDDVETN